MESAAKNVRELNVPARELPSTAGPTNTVNQVGDNAADRSLPTCYGCGKPGHYASSCKYKKQFAINVAKWVCHAASGPPATTDPPRQSIANFVAIDGPSDQQWLPWIVRFAASGPPINIICAGLLQRLRMF